MSVCYGPADGGKLNPRLSTGAAPPFLSPSLLSIFAPSSHRTLPFPQFHAPNSQRPSVSPPVPPPPLPSSACTSLDRTEGLPSREAGGFVRGTIAELAGIRWKGWSGDDAAARGGAVGEGRKVP